MCRLVVLPLSWLSFESNKHCTHRTSFGRSLRSCKCTKSDQRALLGGAKSHRASERASRPQASSQLAALTALIIWKLRAGVRPLARSLMHSVRKLGDTHTKTKARRARTRVLGQIVRAHVRAQTRSLEFDSISVESLNFVVVFLTLASLGSVQPRSSCRTTSEPVHVSWIWPNLSACCR